MSDSPNLSDPDRYEADADDTNPQQATRPLPPTSSPTAAGSTRRRPVNAAEPTRSTAQTRRADPTAGYYPPPPPAGIQTPYSTRARPAPRGGGRGAARSRRDSGLYLPWWSLLLMLALVGGLAFGALLVVGTLGNQAAPGGQTPVFVVITATYTVGPPASLTPIPQLPTLTAPPPLPTIAPTASLPPGNFNIGATVQVIGTGTAGLKVHSGPSVSFASRFLAYDGQKYILKEGPQNADGEEWWHIQDPGNPTNEGWAARRFLTISSP